MNDRLTKMQRTIRLALEIIEGTSLEELEYDIANLLKEAQPFMVYQHPARTIPQNPDNDRVFPLDTIEIQNFKTKYDMDIDNVDNVYIHVGPAADEFTRALQALAVTNGTDIFFRKNAYNPQSEEGRKVLTHELTHVAQYQEGRTASITTRAELENEAEGIERLEGYNTDSKMSFFLEGKQYFFRKSQLMENIHEVSENIRKWLKDQKCVLREKDYLELLCKYKKWLGRAY
jgi:hypothetical protein